MKLFGFNITREGAAPARRNFSRPMADWLAGRDLDDACGEALTNAYEQVAWVYRAVNVLAEQVANIPFVFSSGERGRENLITSGPLMEFYRQPHPQINRFEYWELRIIWLMLRGECVRVPVYREESGGRGRRLERVLILDPARFQHIVEKHELIGWRYTGFGPETPLASQVLLPEEVWFEKLPNPFNFWRGLSPLQAASRAARTDFAASAFMRGVIENNADAGLVVRTDEPLAPEQQEQLVASLRERKRRAGMADRPVLLMGCAEIIKPQLTSTDLQFLENRKFSRGEICAAFGVPEEIVTTTDTAKYNVMQGARLNFVENRVVPLCRRLEAAEEKAVQTLQPGAVGWFDVECLPILQQARRERLVTARTGFEMGVPLNELNRLFDLGFAELPWGNAGYISGKLQKVGVQEPAPGAAETPGAPEQTGEFASRAGFFLRTLRNAARVDDAQHPGPAGKLSRYLFEQRGRVLAKFDRLSCHATGEAGPAFSPAAVLDLELERAEWERCFEGVDTKRCRMSTTILEETSVALEKTLTEGIEQQESGERLTARIKAVYNQKLQQVRRNYEHTV